MQLPCKSKEDCTLILFQNFNRCKYLITLFLSWDSKWPVIYWPVILKTHPFMINYFLFTPLLLSHLGYYIDFFFKITCIGGLCYIWILFQDNKEHWSSTISRRHSKYLPLKGVPSIRTGNHWHRLTSINHSWGTWGLEGKNDLSEVTQRSSYSQWSIVISVSALVRWREWIQTKQGKYM